MEKLRQIIDRIQKLPEDPPWDEATTKLRIVEPCFEAVGWDSFTDIQPEYNIPNAGKVDYALLHENQPQVFIEVKRASLDLNLDPEASQLLEYTFKKGVKIAVFTNGLTWWLYLPLIEGDWTDRKFYTIDLREQELESIIESFTIFLGQENVISGTAVKEAKRELESKLIEGVLNKNVVNAWNKIISEPDGSLVDLLAETTGRICGHTPPPELIKDFLSHNLADLLVSEIEEPDPQPSPPGRPVKPIRDIQIERESADEQRLALQEMLGIKETKALPEIRSGSKVIVTRYSKHYPKHNRYWFGYSKNKLDDHLTHGNYFMAFICGNAELTFIIPVEWMYEQNIWSVAKNGEAKFVIFDEVNDYIWQRKKLGVSVRNFLLNFSQLR